MRAMSSPRMLEMRWRFWQARSIIFWASTMRHSLLLLGREMHLKLKVAKLYGAEEYVETVDRLQRLTSGNSIGIILSETLVGEQRWLVGNTGTSTDVSANANEEEGDEETKKAKQGDGGIERDRDGYDEGARRNKVTGWLWIYVKMMVRSYSVFGLYPSKYVAWNWSEPFIVHSLVCSL